MDVPGSGIAYVSAQHPIACAGMAYAIACTARAYDSTTSLSKCRDSLCRYRVSRIEGIGRDLTLLCGERRLCLIFFLEMDRA